MLSDFVDCSVVDRHARLLNDAQARRAVRAQPVPSLRARVAATRSNIGFRIVEAGLRIALEPVDTDLGMPRARR